MIGAVFGDIAGSAYEFDNPKESGYPLLKTHWNKLKTSHPTDDSVCTFAIAESILTGRLDFADSLRRWGLKYKECGFGSMYLEWLETEGAPAYSSWGNGSIMRASPCALLASSDDEAMVLAEMQSNVTHNHPNAVHAAKAFVIAIRMAFRKESKESIRWRMSKIFGYDLSKNMSDLQAEIQRKFDVSAGGTMRLALTSVLEATSFEEAIRNSIDLGGDTDTTAAVAGPIAEILYGIPESFHGEFGPLLTEEMRDILQAEYSSEKAIKSLNGEGGITVFDEPMFTDESKSLLTGNSVFLRSMSVA